MAQDINGAINQLQNMLSSEDGKRDLENMITSFSGGDNDQPETNQASTPGKNMFGGMNMDMIMRMRDVMDQLQTGDDPRSNLLNALRPYLSQNRHSHLDNAIKMMSLGKLPYILKNFRK